MATMTVREKERWASTLGGAALVMAGARRLAEDRPAQAAVLGAVGAGLMWRGTAGSAQRARGLPTRRTERVEIAISIERPADELYRAWRRLDDIPRFVPNISAVVPIDQRRSRWFARGPGHIRLKWVAELVNDIPNELIAWRTVGDADLESAGSIRFEPEGDRGTTVSVALHYGVPGGKVGVAVATIFGKEPSQALREGLRRFKQIMETGEVPTIEGQPRGAR